MTTEKYLELKAEVIARGYGEMVVWANSLKPVTNAEDFAREYCWVVLCSGMKEQIARQIWGRVQDAIYAGASAGAVFGHRQKAAAIDKIWTQQAAFFAAYQAAADKMAFLRTLPFIGPITVFHLAKNYGVDCCKPDRHLVRIARACGTTPEQLCARLAAATGDRVVTVDTVIWRAANLGLA
jgi:hypothetical protein